MQGKLKIIKDYEKLSQELQEQLKLCYPRGYKKYLVKFRDKEGVFVSALPFETDDKLYMIRMTVDKARKIILKDNDYDDSGQLKSHIRKKYEDEYSDLDYLWDNQENDDYE